MTKRLASLDALRGITIVGMIFVNAAATVHYGLGKEVYGPLLHAPWSGLTLADLVFPAFIFMVGMSIVFSLSGMKERGGFEQGALKKISWRSLKIILIGLILSNLYYFTNFEASFFRPFGVLQRIGIAFFVAAIIYLTCSTRLIAILACVLLVGYIGVLYLPYSDGNVDLSLKGANFVSWFDRAIASGNTYVKGPLGYDPEGVLSTLPTIGQALLGVLTGIWFKKLQESPILLLKYFLAFGAGLIIVGLIIAPVVPIVKDIWSTSYVFVTTGLTLIVFSSLYYMLDHKQFNMIGKNFLLSFGVNSIFAYVIHYLASGVLTWSISALVIEQALAIGLPEKTAALIPIVVFILAHWYLLDVMRRKNWIVKV